MVRYTSERFADSGSSALETPWSRPPLVLRDTSRTAFPWVAGWGTWFSYRHGLDGLRP